jgi:hypothetical protein
MSTLWEYVVRFRTWIVNLVFALMIVAPELLNSPEVLAVIPAEYQRYVLAAAFLVNIWMRPRPAVVKSDPEVDMRARRIGKK